MQTFQVRRHGKPDAIFTGELLAETTSKNDEENKKQWTEVRIYRIETGKYITEIVGRSLIQGHRDRITFNVVENAADVKDALRINGREYITDLALEALEDAAEKDPALRVNLVEAIS